MEGRRCDREICSLPQRRFSMEDSRARNVGSERGSYCMRGGVPPLKRPKMGSERRGNNRARIELGQTGPRRAESGMDGGAKSRFQWAVNSGSSAHAGKSPRQSHANANWKLARDRRSARKGKWTGDSGDWEHGELKKTGTVLAALVLVVLAAFLLLRPAGRPRW